MKTNLTFLFHLLSISLFAQEITQNWIPSLTDTALVNKIITTDFIDPGEAGLDSNWDFSNIDTGSGLQSYSVSYSSPAAFNASNTHFELSNLARVTTDGNGGINFFEVEDLYINLLGDAYPNGNTSNTLNPPVLQFHLPMAFNESISSFSVISVLGINGDVVFTNDLQLNRTFDGIGTLTTPAGTYEDCIRIKEIYVATPPIGSSIIYQNYYWYHEKLSNEMASLSIDESINNRIFRWQLNENLMTTTLVETTLSDIKMNYLNNGFFQIENASGDFVAELFTIDGKKIEDKKIQLNGNPYLLEISTNTLSPTIAVLLLVNLKTKAFHVHKFSY